MPYVSHIKYINFFVVVVIFSFDGTTFDRVIRQSEYSHLWTLGLANYRGKALTTGCNSFGSCRLKTELLDMGTLRVVFKLLFESEQSDFNLQ